MCEDCERASTDERAAADGREGLEPHSALRETSQWTKSSRIGRRGGCLDELAASARRTVDALRSVARSSTSQHALLSSLRCSRRLWPDSVARTDADSRSQVNIPKLRRTYCKGKACRKHTPHKVTQYKTGKASLVAQGSSGVYDNLTHTQESDVTTESSPDTVDKRSPSSTRVRSRLSALV